eukprot:SM000047S16869  [mRNA]  locus=s47:392494:393434:+ [translate_table: standard]
MDPNRERRGGGDHPRSGLSASLGRMSQGQRVVLGTVLALVVGGIFWDLTRNRKIFGGFAQLGVLVLNAEQVSGSVPRTYTKDWLEATYGSREAYGRLDDKERQATDVHVVMNPITRHNYFRRSEEGRNGQK